MISLIISVLDSIEPVKRYLKYLDNYMTEEISKEFEFILVDDGSDIPLICQIEELPKNFNFYIYETNDKRPWTQPAGRNFGASYSNKDSTHLLMTDIDHIITIEAIKECIGFKGDKLIFKRLPAIIIDGNINRDYEVLKDWGLNKEEELNKSSVHANTFSIKKNIFREYLKGYDERFCGQYGGDDVDLNNRYGQLFKEGKVQRHVVASEIIYYYPNPRADIKKVFHNIRRIR